MSTALLHSLADLAEILRASGDYRVLDRLSEHLLPTGDTGTATETAMILDLETTGLLPDRHRIIQLSCLTFDYAPVSGRVAGIRDRCVYYEDPGEPLPPEITRLTGITDADVAGQVIDGAAVERLLAPATVVIAHHAAFDRRFVEARLPIFRDLRWGCSMRDVPWAGQGITGGKLEFLAYKHAGVFFAPHHADVDCLATLLVLAAPFADGSTPLAHLLRAVRWPTVRLWAMGSPFELKDELRMRGYRWNPGDDGRPRSWYRDVGEEDEPGETEWLRRFVYAGRDGWQREVFGAEKRYSHGY